MKKRILKICCAVLALVLICFVFHIYFSFTGNPIIKMIVSNNAKEYVEKTYPHLELQLSSPGFKSKDHHYYVDCISKLGSDIKFSINFSDTGKLLFDNYDPTVKNNPNTIERLHYLYQDEIKSLLKAACNYDYEYILAGITPLEDLSLNCKYDLHSKIIDINVWVSIYTKDLSLAKILLNINNVITENDINVTKYSIWLKNPTSNNDEKINPKILELKDIPVNLLKSEKLSKELENFYKNQQANLGG